MGKHTPLADQTRALESDAWSPLVFSQDFEISQEATVRGSQAAVCVGS